MVGIGVVVGVAAVGAWCFGVWGLAVCVWCCGFGVLCFVLGCVTVLRFVRVSVLVFDCGLVF